MNYELFLPLKTTLKEQMPVESEQLGMETGKEMGGPEIGLFPRA
jgi:hypothetical protein